MLPRLYAITDSQKYGDDFWGSLRKVLERGVKMLQLREKSISGRDYYEKALIARQITKEYSALLLINDRVDIALAVSADGVHLPQNGMPPSAVRKLKKDLIIGFSAHDLESALFAEKEGADFITLSPIFKTSSHPHAEPIGLSALQEVSQKVSIPVYALGGITWEKIKLCYKNGAYGIAGVSLFLE
ncbi:thiamine phosphate synthase [Hydrogenobacter hydrogenophilus]|uniref:Thiamine-phosphate synthase n=1 Tax=Hydrogenobacter hydrogenophilus TaxID=35835 RepID=A0A285NY60_9AQUI|nr:thiamine phosphate synthase [Hydrogenobacter hydrogenophilus]SNZ14379.1 thiamine-phosphate pyrophosphorylase [Hydrogenobacter hydrogenophilus]